MKPEWDKLSDEFADSQKVVIADVDCTASGKALCEKYGVQGCELPASHGAQACRLLLSSLAASNRPDHQDLLGP